MGLEFTRGNNARCPPFLVGGLMIMCLFLLCSWWSLSSQNFELLRQNDNLAEQLRINGEELRKCQTQVAQQEIQIKQIKDTDQDLQLECQKQRDMCQTEMESLKKVRESQENNLETLRIKTQSLEKDIEDGKKQVNDMKKELEDKKAKIADLEKRISSMKTTSVHTDLKEPIVKTLERSAKKKEKLEINQKLNDVPIPARQDNVESVLMRDENIGAEARLEDGVVDPGDPREQEMADNPNNVETS